MSKSKDARIELDPKTAPRLRSFGMNWACMAQKPFQLRPSSFTSTIEGMKPKTISQKTQLDSYDTFIGMTEHAGVFGISSAPTDGPAKLLAAYMMELHLKASPNNRPRWHDLTTSFSSDLMSDEGPAPATMLVLNNVGPDALPVKREKLRDILERYSDIPIVVVVNGSDPVTFFTRDLRKALSGVIHMAGPRMKTHDI